MQMLKRAWFGLFHYNLQKSKSQIAVFHNKSTLFPSSKLICSEIGVVNSVY